MSDLCQTLTTRLETNDKIPDAGNRLVKTSVKVEGLCDPGRQSHPGDTFQPRSVRAENCQVFSDTEIVLVLLGIFQCVVFV